MNMNLTQGKLLAATAFTALLLSGSALASPAVDSAIQEGPLLAQESGRVGNYQYMRDRRRGYDPRYQEPNTYYPEETSRNRNTPYSRRNGQLDPRDQSVQNGVYQYDWERQGYDPNYQTNRSRYDGRYNANGTLNPNYDPRYDRNGNYDPRYDANHNEDPRYNRQYDPRYNNGQYTNGQYQDQDRAVQVGPFRIKY